MEILKETQPKIQNPKPVSYRWKENPSIQMLLDVLANTLSEEFIETAKQHPETFKQHGGTK